MRNLLSLLVLSCLIGSSLLSYAQVTKKMSYQGAVRDMNGAVLMNKDVTLKLHIISEQDIDNPVYSEMQTTTTNAFGLINLKIGEGQVVDGSFNSVEWGEADHFIAVELDAENNGHFVQMGVSQLLSVPYAFYAEKAGMAKDVENADQYRDIPFSGIDGQTIRHNGSDWEASSLLFNDGTNIGIGTDRPEAKLHVIGNIELGTGGEITFDGDRALAMDGSRNIMQGRQSGQDLTTGVNNNFIGYRAGWRTTSGSNNSMIGYQAGYNNTTGVANMFLGYKAGYGNTIGGNNFYGGLNAGYNSTSGVNNVALGTNSGFSLNGGNNNVFIGRNSGFNTTTNENVFIGYEAGRDNTTGTQNTYIGTGADGSATLVNATAIGSNALVTQDNSVVLGNAANIGIGTSAPNQKLHVVGDARITGAIYDSNNETGTSGQVLSSTVTGTDWMDAGGGSNDTLPIVMDADKDTKIQAEENPDEDIIRFDMGGTEFFTMNNGRLEVINTGRSVFYGAGAGYNDNFSNNDNVFIGDSAGYNSTSSLLNVAIGSRSFYANTTGSGNTAVGYKTLEANTIGTGNSAIGFQTLFSNMTGVNNSAVGNQALRSNTTGHRNTASGQEALRNNTSGTSNTAIGQRALYTNTTRSNLVAVGDSALFSNGSGASSAEHSTNNTAVGSKALVDNTVGYKNTAIGYQAGISNTNGAGNTYLGSGADGSATLVNATAIGSDATVTQDSSVVLGNAANVGIGTSAPDAKLHVVGEVMIEDGNEGNGKVLTSDASGVASWQTPAASGASTLDEAYDGGGTGAGKMIIADSGAVHIGGEDGFLVTGTYLSGDTVKVSGSGMRMFFNPSKGAFRAGQIAGSDGYWDNDSIGLHSVAMGFNTLAKDFASFAMGNSSQATGYASVALGYNTIASGDYATALGLITDAGGGSSIAMGYSTEASGDYATALGSLTNANGHASTAMGTSTIASGYFSTALGLVTTAESYGEVAIGAYNTDYTPNDTSDWDTGDRLFVVGNGTGTSSRSDAMVIMKDGDVGIGTSTPINRLAVYSTSDNVATFQGQDHAIINIDGTDTREKAISFKESGVEQWKVGMDNSNSGGSTDDFIIKQTNNGIPELVVNASTGNVGIGYSSASYNLHVNGSVAGIGAYVNTSDRKFKTNIQPIGGSALDKINQLQGVSYDWKLKEFPEKKFDNRKQLGFIAQDVEAIVPEAVSIDKEGNYGLSYSTFIPVLVEAVKELRAENEELRRRLEAIEGQ